MRVYLIPDEDSTYVCCVSDDALSTDAIFLVEEGHYPTTAWHHRHDLNMDTLLMKEEIKDRDELLKYLDFQGKCRNEIVRLWNYYTYNNSLVELHRLFDKCYERKAELIVEAMLEACEGIKACDAPAIPAITNFESNPDRLPF